MSAGFAEIVFLVTSIIASFVVAVWLTAWVKRYSLKNHLLDIPNDRGSHQEVTPRGGGIAIIVPVVLVTVIVMLFTGQHYLEYGTLILTVVSLAMIGWLDDHKDQPVLRRVGVHMMAGIIVLYGIGSVEYINIDSLKLGLSPLAGIITVLWVAWMANLYNFMDGIDGLVAGHTAISACAIGLWFSLSGDLLTACVCYSLMAASLGFLIWNWEPARIFMGDVGSVAIGGLLAGLAVLGYQAYQIPIMAFVLLFLVFLTDTGLTLLSRVRRRKVLWQAHREHYYQRAVATGWSHAQVTTCLLLTNIVLAVLASLVALNVGWTWLWLLLGLLVVISLAQMVRFAEHSNTRNSNAL